MILSLGGLKESFPASEGKRTEKLQKLQTVKKALSGKDKFLILLSHIDPDALACAVSFKEIIRQINSDAVVAITYCGEMNRSGEYIINACNLADVLTPASDYLIAPDETVVLLDSNTCEDSRIPDNLRGIVPVIIVDHHDSDYQSAETETIELLGERFVWIDKQAGSASTMVLEIAQSIGVTLSEMSLLLLSVGIYTDTEGLRCSYRDLEAYNKASSAIGKDKLAPFVVGDPVSLGDIHYCSLSFNDDGTRVVSGVDIHRWGIKDGLNKLVDFAKNQLKNSASVLLSVAWGVIGDMVEGFIVIKARSRRLGMPLKKFLEDRFGKGAGAKINHEGEESGGIRVKIKDIYIFYYTVICKGNMPAIASELTLDHIIKDLVFHQ